MQKASTGPLGDCKIAPLPTRTISSKRPRRCVYTNVPNAVGIPLFTERPVEIVT